MFKLLLQKWNSVVSWLSSAANTISMEFHAWLLVILCIASPETSSSTDKHVIFDNFCGNQKTFLFSLY